MPLENEKIEVAEEKETEMPNVEELLKILLDVNLEQNRQTVHLLMNYMNDIEENFFSVLEELDTVMIRARIIPDAITENGIFPVINATSVASKMSRVISNGVIISSNTVWCRII